MVVETFGMVVNISGMVRIIAAICAPPETHTAMFNENWGGTLNQQYALEYYVQWEIYHIINVHLH